MRAFLADYVDGLDWYYDPANREKAIEIVAAFTKSPKEVLDTYFATERDYYRDPQRLRRRRDHPKADRCHARGEALDRQAVDAAKYLKLSYLPKPCAM